MGGKRRIRTVLYGDQVIEPTELDLLHTPALQRLYDLHQLGLTDRVFIDASHSRLHHVIGVLQQVDNILEAMTSNLASERPVRVLEYQGGSITTSELANYIQQRRKAARLMGLLHDITHGPFGHTLEDEIELHPLKHDDPSRQADAFYRLILQYLGWLALDAGTFDNRTVLSEHVSALRDYLSAPESQPPAPSAPFVKAIAKIGAQFVARGHAFRAFGRAPRSEEIERLLRDLRFSMRALLWLDALHKDRLDDLLPDQEGRRALIEQDGNYPFEKVIDAILQEAGLEEIQPGDRVHVQRDALLLDVIGNTICADLLDYAKRDSHYAGLKLDYDVDRIVENFTVVSYRRPRAIDGSKRGYSRDIDPILRTAIKIFSHKLRIDAPGELMNLLQVRFYVYQRVLFHPTKCVAGAMLGSALQLIGWKTIPIQFRFVGDAVFLHEIGVAARMLRELIRPHLENGEKLLENFAPNILAALDRLPTTLATNAVRQLVLDSVDRPVGAIGRDLDAALRLLQRLGARRYHRPVFRLLPNAEVPSLNLDAEHIAEIFIDPGKRAEAERLIEDHCGLPRGTTTIHCPRGDGPKKIAEILILGAADGERVFPLRQISKIDREIFSKHEEAITALEEMYRSMWRLTVSVAPPYMRDHAMINKRIGRVLFSVMREQPYEQVYGKRSEDDLDVAVGLSAVPNDERMEAELASATTEYERRVPEIEVLHPDGRRLVRPLAFLEVADQAVSRLSEVNPTISGYLASGRIAANAPGATTIKDLIADAIPKSSATGTGDASLDRKQKSARVSKQADLLEGDEKKG